MLRLAADTARGIRASWRRLIVTDILYKILAFVVLTPLVGMLLRALLALFGHAAVSDMDVVLFCLGPAGWVCLVLLGSLTLAIVALEQASLLGILCARAAGQDLAPMAALQFAGAHAWPVIRVTTRLVGWTLLASAPFLAIAAGAYWMLLSDYDINFYLRERPPVFWVALGLATVMAVALVALLLRLCAGWFYALPLVLFESVTPRDALRVSAARAHGHRRLLLRWIAAWLMATAALSVVGTALVALVGRWLIPACGDSLRLLAAAVGCTLLVWAVVTVIVNVLSTTTLAALLFQLYRELGRDAARGPLGGALASVGAVAGPLRISARWAAISAAASFVLATAVGAAALHSVRLEDQVQIMAHRGSSRAAPENTLAAIRQAIEDGADWVEIDVQETADGEVVVFHDSDFMRLGQTDLKIWDATVDDLRTLDIGSWFAPEFHAERVPTLADVLQMCRGKIGVNIELKYYGHQDQLESRVASIVESHDMVEHVVFMSLDMDGVRRMKATRPAWTVGLLMSVLAGGVKHVPADFVAVNARFAGRSLVRSAHQSGKKVYVWTVNDAPTISMMISRGVDGILTDKPALARAVVTQRAAMSAPERLLLQLAGLLGRKPEIGDQ